MSILKDILKKYCEFENPEKTGLFLIDLPTGFGKTYNVFDYIYETYDKNPDKKILFITNLKKNLEPERLQDRFEDKSIFDEKAIFVDSNVDYVLKRFLQVEKIIPDEFQDTPEFQKLKENIKFYDSLGNTSDINKLKWKENIKEEIRTKDEPNFRYFIQSQIYKKYKKKEERIKAIEIDTLFNWLPDLYPTVLSHKKQIFFLSVDKFLVKNAPIIESSYHFTDNNFLKNALIFIDEFDASKDIFLKHIIDNQLQRKIDLIGLFSQIFTSLNSFKLPEIFKKNSKKRDRKIQNLRNRIEELKTKTNLSKTETAELKKKQKQEQFELDIKEIIQNLIDEVNKINNKYEITYFIKTKDLEQDKNFLFHDYRYHTIIGGDENFIYLRKDETENIRYIEFDKHKKDYKDRPNIIEYISITKGFINYFKKKSAIIAENYQQIKQEQALETDYEFLFENALRTFFNALNIDNNFQNYLIDTIEQRNYKKQNRKSNLKDVSFYSKGFRYFDFEDSEQHDVQSKIYISSFDTTPEQILLNLAENNFIVGISATAKNKSVIGNFDLKYLEKNLKQNFIDIDKEEKITLQTEFTHKKNGYDNAGVKIHSKLLKSSGDIELQIENITEDEAVSNKIYTEIEKTGQYFQERYIRITKAFEEFIKTDEIKSMICFLNALPSNKKQNLKTKILEELFDVIIKKHNKQSSFFKKDKYSVENSFYILNSTNFEAKITNIKKRLSKGEKIFLISTYQTIGAGQNIQYKIPENLKTVEIFDRGNSNTKDFDAVYLDKPTNLLVNIKGEKIDEFNLAKRIFHLEMLFADQEIFYNHLIYEIKQTFKKAFEKYYKVNFPAGNYKNLQSTDNYYNFAVKQIIQAIGRINRTNNKNQDIYIFADNQLADIINNYDYTDKLLLKEFEELIKECKYQITTNEDTEKINPSIEFVNFNSYNFIKDKIKSKWIFEEDIEEWKELREFVLENPTLSIEEHEKTDWSFIYMKLSKINNKYFYVQQNDFLNVEIDFNNDIGKTISETEVYLPQLMDIDFIRKFFEQNNYAKTFTENNYIVAPIIFNNIYKGALGEIIGKLIIEEFLQIKLNELTKENFEKFDFVYKNYYIDFKFWNDAISSVSKEKLHNHIYNKIKQTNAEKALIVNILAEGEYDIQTTLDGKIIEVPYLIDKQSFEIDLNIISKLKNILK